MTRRDLFHADAVTARKDAQEIADLLTTAWQKTMKYGEGELAAQISEAYQNVVRQVEHLDEYIDGLEADDTPYDRAKGETHGY